MRRIYLDYAATTPIDPLVLRAMEPYFSEKFGNPGSLHSFGQEAIAVVDASRETIARVIGAKQDEIIFTGSATEANNLALRGSIRGLTRILQRGLTQINIRENQRVICDYPRPRLIISAIEHESVLETARDLEKDGVEVIYLPIDKRGVVDLGALKKALNERTILVSVMYANNEIGAVQPISAIAKIIADFKNSKHEARSSKQTRSTNVQNNKQFRNSKLDIISDFGFRISDFEATYPLLHVDAAQAFQFLDCDVNKLGVDLMTLSAHKIYGPKGVGALYVGSREKEVGSEGISSNAIKSPILPTSGFLSPVVTGGGQEFGLRSGTENVPAIVGFAKAVEIASGVRGQESRRIGELRDYFWSGLRDTCPEARINADVDADKHGKNIADKLQITNYRLPNILNVYFPNHEAQFLLTKLDIAGVAASSGSACRSRAMESSYVVEALGYSNGSTKLTTGERAKRSVRFSFGRPTTKGEIDEALKIIEKCLD